jgi:hypothetical protein
MVLGVITKASVPLPKHVNLYQKGFLSESGMLVHLLGIFLLPQMGTDA